MDNSKQISIKKTLEPERFIKNKISRLLLPLVKTFIKDDVKICDIGGASGFFLNCLLISSEMKIRTYLLEVSNYYKEKLINSKIKFINESILDNSLETDEFDIVTFINLLHHLVSTNIFKTLEIQKKALNEVFRITKKGGYVIFLERVNEVNLFSKIIYIISKFFNLINTSLKYLQIGKVIVYFLSSRKIRELINHFKKVYNLKILREILIPQSKIKGPLKWRFLFLTNKMGWIIQVIQVLKQ